MTIQRVLESKLDRLVEVIESHRVVSLRVKEATVPLAVKFLRALERRGAVVFGVDAELADRERWVASIVEQFEKQIASEVVASGAEARGLDRADVTPLAPPDLVAPERLSVACERLARWLEPIPARLVVVIRPRGDLPTVRATVLASARMSCHPHVHFVVLDSVDEPLLESEELGPSRLIVEDRQNVAPDPYRSVQPGRVFVSRNNLPLATMRGRVIRFDAELQSKLGFARSVIAGVTRHLGVAEVDSAPGRFPYGGYVTQTVERLLDRQPTVLDIVVRRGSRDLIVETVHELASQTVEPSIRYVLRLPAECPVPPLPAERVVTHTFAIDTSDLESGSAEAAADEGTSAEERFRAHLMLSGIAIKKGKEDTALAEAQKAVEAARAVGDPALEAMAFLSFGNALLRFTRYDSAARAYETTHDIALKSGAAVLAALATVQLGHTKFLAGRYVDAAARYRSAYDYYGRVNMVDQQCSAATYLGDSLARLDLGSEALETWANAIATLDRAGLSPEQAGYIRSQLLLRLERAHRERGALGEARAAAKQLEAAKASDLPIVEIG